MCAIAPNPPLGSQLLWLMLVLLFWRRYGFEFAFKDSVWAVALKCSGLAAGLPCSAAVLRCRGPPAPDAHARADHPRPTLERAPADHPHRPTTRTSCCYPIAER